MKGIKEPVRVAAAVRQKAALGKPPEAKREPEKAKEKEPEKFWLKIQSLYDDRWDTPLPVFVQVTIDNTVHAQKIELVQGEGKSTRSSNLEKAQKTMNEPGTALLEDIPDGVVEVEVEREAGVEQDIAELKSKLHRKLDGSYRELVSDMSPFQQQWNKFGYGSLVFNGTEGLWDGSSAWMKDQAELFDAELWVSFVIAYPKGCQKH